MDEVCLEGLSRNTWAPSIHSTGIEGAPAGQGDSITPMEVSSAFQGELGVSLDGNLREK